MRTFEQITRACCRLSLNARLFLASLIAAEILCITLLTHELGVL